MVDLSYEYFAFASLAILGFVEWLKSLDPKNKLKNLYRFFPMVLSIPSGIIVMKLHGLGWSTAPFFIGSVLAFSVLGYTSGVELIQKLLKAKAKDIEELMSEED